MAEYKEAPFSITYSLMDKDGFPSLFSIRGETLKEILGNITEVKTIFLSEGYKGQERKFGNTKPSAETVPNRPCPTCGQPLIYGTTKDGKRFIKCSTQRWDFTTKKALGCPFIEWQDSKQDIPTVVQNNQGTQGELATMPQKNLIMNKFPELWIDGMTKQQATEVIRTNLGK